MSDSPNSPLVSSFRKHRTAEGTFSSSESCSDRSEEGEVGAGEALSDDDGEPEIHAMYG